MTIAGLKVGDGTWHTRYVCRYIEKVSAWATACVIMYLCLYHDNVFVDVSPVADVCATRNVTQLFFLGELDVYHLYDWPPNHGEFVAFLSKCFCLKMDWNYQEPAKLANTNENLRVRNFRHPHKNPTTADSYWFLPEMVESFTPPKVNIEPKHHVRSWKGKSSSKPPFSGAMLVSGRVVPFCWSSLLKMVIFHCYV